MSSLSTSTSSGLSTTHRDLTAINNQGTKHFRRNSILPGAAASGQDSVAIGPKATASGAASVAVGLGAQATGPRAVSIRTYARAGNDGAALGNGADACGTPASAVPLAIKGTAIGFGTVVQQTASVALGAGAVTRLALEPEKKRFGLAMGTYAGESAVGVAFDCQTDQNFNAGIRVSSSVSSGARPATRVQLGYGW